MIKNYLLIGLRSLQKHRFYSIINIMGLGLGMAASLMLSAWIIHELSYDSFHEKSARIYRASLEYSFGGQTSKTSVSPTALLPALQKNFAEVETGVRMYNPSSYNPYIIRRDDRIFQEGRFFYADSTFFQIFSFKLIKGNPTTALTQPNSVVLTQSTAEKYFGDSDPMGKGIIINNKTDYVVTGIIADIPTNSLLQFDFIGSFSSLDAAKEQIWWSANYETYLLLAPSTNVEDLSRKTETIVNAAIAGELTHSGDYVRYNFMPFTDIYLRSDMKENAHVNDIQYIYIFGAIALLVLIIACINYINLATARAADRAKEVGIRKVVGALQKQLFFQFIGESVIITTLSLGVALLLVRLAIPAFDQLTGKVFASGVIFSVPFLAAALVLTIFIALLAGAYPALAITSFKPIHVLRGNFKSSGKGIWLRKSLVVFQFGVSVVLIIGTLVIIKQLDYIQDKKLGYDRENVVVLPMDSNTKSVYDQLKTEITKSGIASHVARATESPTSIQAGYSIKLEGQGSGAALGMIVTAMSIDQDFVPALTMEMVAGRNFTDGDFSRAKKDTLYSFILNETAIRELGLVAEAAIGTRVNMNDRRGEIVGIVNDFHFASLQKKITPLVFFNDESDYSYTFITLQQGDTEKSIATLKGICHSLTPHRPFEYTFLDQEYTALYNNEQRMGKIITTFAGLTVIIACLGLLGLVSFSAAQKTKEIGIRKVLGATAPSIVVLITKDFTRLVVLAIVIGLPLAYWAMTQWLNGFAYKTAIGILPIFTAAFLCLFIAFGTAAYQAIKAAMLNPADTLRNE